jgi:phage terminase large subunit
MIYGDAIYSKELIYKTGLLTKNLNDHMVKLGIRKDLPIYCDNIPKEVAELAVYGWNLVKVPKPPGSVLHGINLMKQYDHYIHASSLNAQEEFDNYEWIKKDGEYIETPIDKWNHFIDGKRYYCMINLPKGVYKYSQQVTGEHLI